MTTMASAGSNVVDTGKVAGRRILHFDSIDQLLDEIDRLAAAERAGRLKRVGNWTLGQALGHLATWAEYAYTGVPIKPPFFLRWILRFQRKKFFVGPMPAGVKIPKVAGGTLGTEALPLEEGLVRCKCVLERLKNELPTLPNPIFGKLTHEDSIAVTLRHAELHLGFFVPK